MCSINGKKVIQVRRAKPITAYRVCRVYENVLTPQHYNYGIHAGAWNNRFSRTNATPELWNTSGLHALRTVGGAKLQRGQMYNVVLVRVALWGRVVEGTRGYRAEFAKVTGIRMFEIKKHGLNKFLSPRALAALRRRYQCRGFQA